MKRLFTVIIACGIAVPSLLAHDKMTPPLKIAPLKITPMNVKTGLWQSTTTLQVSGDVSQPRIETQKGCIRQEDLTRNPFAPGKNDEGMRCTENLLRSNSSDAEVDMSCKDDQGNSSEFHIAFHTLDQEHVTGSGQGTARMSGHIMKSDWQFQSQWLQASCPVEMR
jgi:hypothetical protein